jgi:N-acetyl-1-D-myo-inositol-2-amino-2-deoxy-alpha-D-glucopyranoside deacetylase
VKTSFDISGDDQPRILFVHPHPDDETIVCGATMAHYVQQGAQVTLVTCTLGEEGEIYLPEIAQFTATEADQLGGYRYTELAAAAKALGVTDFRFLGGAGKYRDSGMMDTPANKHPRAFWQADLDEAASYLATIIDEIRPQVVVTDNEKGSYGHPDHIQTNKVTVAAIERANWRVSKLYYHAMPRSVIEKGLEDFVGAANNPFADITSIDELDFLTPDDKVDIRIDAAPFKAQKRAALQAHASQIPADSWLFIWAESLAGEAEYFQEVATAPVSDCG